MEVNYTPLFSTGEFSYIKQPKNLVAFIAHKTILISINVSQSRQRNVRHLCTRATYIIICNASAPLPNTNSIFYAWANQRDDSE
jgi:hypothetical protein